MSNELLEILPDLGSKANDMTHGLKEYGNGSMFEGIRAMCVDSYTAGKNIGLKEGAVYGVLGTVLIGAFYVGGKWVIRKVSDAKKKKETVPPFVAGLTDAEIKAAERDTSFPWEQVKAYIRNNYGINQILFDTWIEPLVCKAYKERVLLEFPASSNGEITYLKNKYRQIIKDSIYTLTGKKYIVTFVRLGEIIIEDDEL